MFFFFSFFQLLLLKTISGFKIVKFEFKVTVHLSLWAKAPSCDPLTAHNWQK